VASAPAVALRPVEDGDLRFFFDWQADEESSRMAAVASRDEEAFAAHWSRIRSDPDCMLRTIVVDGDVAGHALSWTAAEGRVVGYWLGKTYWGRGIATVALRLYLEEEVRRPLRATVAEHNTGSCRVLEKTGFRLVSSELVDDEPELGTITLLQFQLG
jgi:RimJ/RimL family protein N-acetyltransferase